MVEAAVRRALVETRKAPEDLTSYTGESGAEGFTVATTTARVPANHCTHLTKEYLSTISVGPKKQRTEKTSYRYRFGTATVVQHRTQRLNRGGAKSHSLEVTQTIFVLTFNTW